MIILVRHALPAVDPTVSSRLWPLSEEGREATKELASRLRLPDGCHVVSSDEVKARATAELLAGEPRVDPGLREVDRPWTGADHGELARAWLTDETVEGWESRQSVSERMAEAVLGAIDAGDGPVCLVTHGLAMSAYVSTVVDIDPVEFWERLDYPDARVLDVQARRVGSV